MDRWDQRFMEMARLTSTWSKDPSTKVGAVIVDERRIVRGLGYNGFPRGVRDGGERYDDRLVKYKLVVHAELNAILNTFNRAAGCIIYSTQFPCTECTKAIIQSGIDQIVSPPLRSDSSWAPDAEFSRQMLAEAGVSVREVIL